MEANAASYWITAGCPPDFLLCFWELFAQIPRGLEAIFMVELARVIRRVFKSTLRWTAVGGIDE